MAKKYASDYARDIGTQIQDNVSQVIALKQKARADEAEAKRYAEQQARLDREEAAALRKEARQIEIDRLNRENLDFERQFKISAEERAISADRRAEEAGDRAERTLSLQEDKFEQEKQDKFIQENGLEGIETSVLDRSKVDIRDSKAYALAFQEFQEAGINAKRNPGDPEAQARWQRAKQQKETVEGIAEARSAVNQETFQRVQFGEFDNLSTDITTEQERWANYNLTQKIDDNGDAVFDANGEPVMVSPNYFMQNGTLMVGEEGSPNAVPWNESRYADPADVYTPLLVAKETAFNSTDYANTVAEETFDPSKMRSFTILDPETNLGTGELDMVELDKTMTDRAITDLRQNVHLRNQIALEQYNEDTPGKDYLDSDDQRKALEKYNPEVVNVRLENGTSVVDGKFKDGKWEFTLSDGDIEDQGNGLTTDEQRAVKDYRKAYKNYVDRESSNVQAKIIPIDERPEIERIRYQKERDAVADEARRNAAASGGSGTGGGPTAPTFTALTTTPPTEVNGMPVPGRPTFNFPGNESLTIPGTDFGFPEVAVQGVEFDPATGEVAAYTLTVPNSVLVAAQRAAGNNAAQQANVQTMFDKAVATKVTPDNPLFATITNDIRNTTSGSNRRPGPQARIDQAKNELTIYNYFADAGLLSTYDIDSVDGLTPEILRRMAEDYNNAGQ